MSLTKHKLIIYFSRQNINEFGEKYDFFFVLLLWQSNQFYFCLFHKSTQIKLNEIFIYKLEIAIRKLRASNFFKWEISYTIIFLSE